MASKKFRDVDKRKKVLYKTFGLFLMFGKVVQLIAQKPWQGKYF